MSRLIDADAFCAFLREVSTRQHYETLLTNKDKYPTVSDVIEEICCDLDGTSLDGFDNAPTVEITENQAILLLMKSGWLVNNEAEWKIKGNKIECSKCENRVFVGTNDIGVLNEEMLLFKFCPNCGAKMKGGAEK